MPSSPTSLLISSLPFISPNPPRWVRLRRHVWRLLRLLVRLMLRRLGISKTDQPFSIQVQPFDSGSLAPCAALWPYWEMSYIPHSRGTFG